MTGISNMTNEEFDVFMDKLKEVKSRLYITRDLYKETPSELNKINHLEIVKEHNELMKSWKIDKVAYKQVQDAWKRFDRTTAYGCANNAKKYDIDVNQREWEQYNRLLTSLNISAVLTAPIGLK